MEPRIHLLKPALQTYAWGSKTAIAELIGQPNPTDEPQAELWFGAHPKAPARIIQGDQRIPLNDAIAAHPADILGAPTAQAFSDQLPFLLKILAAEEPLSIQAHPNLEQARAGFARENAAGIPLDAPDRNYRDDNHKPELICALTEFWGMCGFRRPETIAPLFDSLGVTALRDCLAPLRERPDRDTLRSFFQSLMALPESTRRQALDQAAGAPRMESRLQAESRGSDSARMESRLQAESCGLNSGTPYSPETPSDPVRHWVRELRQRYPDDAGALAPVFLNLVKLEPGEALYLAAGELHAYLHGLGVEIMANSDNVLRGGLTPKHVDVPELLRLLTFHGADAEILKPALQDTGEWLYPSPAREFRLSRIDLAPATPYQGPADRSVEILLCVEGRARLSAANLPAPLDLPRGASALIPALSPPYRLEGQARIFKASVPRQE